MDDKVLILIIIILGIAVVGLGISYTLHSRACRRKLINAQELISYHQQLSENLGERLSAMSQISLGFRAADSEQEIIDLILANTMKAAGAAGASFVPLDDRGKPKAAIHQGNFPFPSPDAWLEYLASPPVRQQCNNCKNHGTLVSVCPLIHSSFSQTVKLYCLPLHEGDQVLGILNLYMPNECNIGSDSREFLNSIVDQAELAIKSMRLRKREQVVLNGLQIDQKKQDFTVMLMSFLSSIKDALEADNVLLALDGYGIDSLSKQVRIDHLTIVGEKISEDERNLIGDLFKQVYTTGKEFNFDNWTFEHSSNKLGEAMMAVPLIYADQSCMGVVAAGRRANRPFGERERSLFRIMTVQIALLVENSRDLPDRQLKVIIEERGRLAREIHDGLAQTISFLKMHTAQMQSSLENKDFDRLEYLLKVSYSALAEAYQDIREAIDGLRLIGFKPNDEFPVGLDVAIQRVVQEYRDNNMMPSVSINVQCSENIIELTPEVITQILRILQEAFSNIRKHSGADEVWIKTCEDDKDVVLEIIDNGKGFASEDILEISKHGLAGMRERAEHIGADFQVISLPGKGTTIIVRLPIVVKKKMEM